MRPRDVLLIRGLFQAVSLLAVNDATAVYHLSRRNMHPVCYEESNEN
jgi:hypothetical protein